LLTGILGENFIVEPIRRKSMDKLYCMEPNQQLPAQFAKDNPCWQKE
jgi:hypothetical protein